MHKVLAGLVVAIVCGMCVMAPVRAGAAPPSGEVVIGGRVTDSGSIMAYYPIAISCKGKLWANFVAIVHTTLKGYYGTHTTTKLCPLGSIVEVRIDVDGDGKFEIGTQDIVRRNTTVNLFVELGNMTVPEFGWLGGVAAAGVGYGVVVLVRKRAAGHMGEG